MKAKTERKVPYPRLFFTFRHMRFRRILNDNEITRYTVENDQVHYHALPTEIF